jgi:hypothetical protein
MKNNADGDFSEGALDNALAAINKLVAERKKAIRISRSSNTVQKRLQPWMLPTKRP